MLKDLIATDRDKIAARDARIAALRELLRDVYDVAKDGEPKIVEKCDLPLTGAKVVDRIISDLAIFDIKDGGLVLRKLAPGVSVEEITEKTGADFVIDFSEEKL